MRDSKNIFRDYMPKIKMFENKDNKLFRHSKTEDNSINLNYFFSVDFILI